jgi:hypothetical protein
MDVLSAMEAVEDASGKYNARKKTPPSSATEEKKRLIRELGRKPSEEKVSLYVRKPSVENAAPDLTPTPQQQQKEEASRAQKFLDSMSRR